MFRLRLNMTREKKTRHNTKTELDMTQEKGLNTRERDRILQGRNDATIKQCYSTETNQEENAAMPAPSGRQE